MSIHTKKLSIDNSKDKSDDILSILESIQSLFEVCQNVVNTYTQEAIFLSITTEAEMLLLKLKVMEKRWNIHLPFKEASTVDFLNWSRTIKRMAQAIGGTGESEKKLDEYCPTKHYLLDLYECLDESPSHHDGTPYYAVVDVSKFIAEQKRIRKQIIKKWDVYRDQFSELVSHELNPHIGDELKPLADHSADIRKTCHSVLSDLSAILRILHDTPRGNISHDQFARLAERVINEDEYEGRKAKATAEHELNELKNNTPEDQWETRREEEIKVALELIKVVKQGNKVFSFLGRDKTMLDNLAGMGRYLWSVRHSISDGDLYDIIELLYRVAYLEKDRQQQAVMDEQAASVQASRPEPKDAEAVFRKRLNAKPKKPRLPNFFNEKLASNKTAVECYYETLHHCGFFIGRTLVEQEKKDPNACCYAGWKWKNLRDAFVKLGFFKADSPKKGFADHLAEVFPYLESASVQRGFNSRGGYVDNNANTRIVNDMVAEFKDVADLMK